MATDGERYLGHQSLCLDIRDTADELIPATDPAEIVAALLNIASFAGAIEKFIDLLFRDAMVTTGGFDRSDLALIDPLFEGGIADAQNLGRFAGRK